MKKIIFAVLGMLAVTGAFAQTTNVDPDCPLSASYKCSSDKPYFSVNTRYNSVARGCHTAEELCGGTGLNSDWFYTYNGTAESYTVVATGKIKYVNFRDSNCRNSRYVKVAALIGNSAPGVGNAEIQSSICEITNGV